MTMQISSRFEQTRWTEGYRAWLKGHEYREQHHRFPKRLFGLEANPYPENSAEHDAWSEGWFSAFDDYESSLPGE